jgi:hypothetical protein
MKRSRLTLFLVIAVAALSHRSDGQQPLPISEQLRLASVMPGGALVYLQTRDLSALLKTWLASPVHDRFYKSDSFTAFSRSRIYLKLQDRRKDFEKALGFGLDEKRLAELAGGASALALYDIGKLELAFVTEASRERAIATVLFKSVPQFQERSSEGAAYYVRDISTDGGRLNQQFCFAHAGGKLIVTTTEGLMLRALKNAKGAGTDSLIAAVTSAAESAGSGFSTHDVTMWLDQARLNKNRYFTVNWIHGNASEKGSDSLANLESGIIDLELKKEGMFERRWFRLSSQAGELTPLAGDQLAITRFAPGDAQFMELHPPGSALNLAIADALFGKLPNLQPGPPQIPDRTYSSDSDSDDEASSGTGRYSSLDTRFDKDVDDEPTQATETASVKPGERLAKALSSLVGGIRPAGYLQIARSKTDAGRPFVRFERAVVIEMGSGAGFDAPAFERLITDELRERFVVKGVEPKLEWQEETNVRYVAQSLMEQGAAYAVSDRYLVLASNKEFARDILRAASAPGSTAASAIEGPTEFYARVRVAAAKPVFDRLMSKLDGRFETAAAAGEESEREIKFFSENLSSLISATGVNDMRLVRRRNQGVMAEVVVYSW